MTASAEIIEDATRILAANQSQANTLVSRKLPDEILADPEKFDRLVVVVRPF